MTGSDRVLFLLPLRLFGPLLLLLLLPPVLDRHGSGPEIYQRNKCDYIYLSEGAPLVRTLVPTALPEQWAEASPAAEWEQHGQCTPMDHSASSKKSVCVCGLVCACVFEGYWFSRDAKKD